MMRTLDGRLPWWSVGVVLLVVVAVACGDTGAPAPATRIEFFRAQESGIERGAEVALEWRVVDAGSQGGPSSCALLRRVGEAAWGDLAVVPCEGSHTDVPPAPPEAASVTYRLRVPKAAVDPTDPYLTSDVEVAFVVPTVSLLPSTATLRHGEALDITATVTGTVDAGVSWSTTCGSIAPSGSVATFTAPASDAVCSVTAASVADPRARASCVVTVTGAAPQVVQVTIAQGDIDLVVGQAVALSAQVDSVGGADPSVAWSTNDDAIATVSPDGVVTGVAVGLAEVTATSTFDPSKSDTVAVSVAYVPGTAVWSRVFGTSAEDDAAGVAVDSSGRVVLAGGTGGDLAGPVGGIMDAYVRVYEADGTPVWIRQFGTSSEDFATDVAVDASDAVIVVGYTRGVLAPGGSADTDSDAFVRKYDRDGNVVWTRQFGTTQHDSASSVAVDSGGGIVVAGDTTGALGGPYAGGGDAFVRKYDAEGSVLWTLQYGAASADFANDVALDEMGNVFVVGSTSTGAPDYDSDAVLRVFSADGNPSWSAQFGSSEGDVAAGVAVDRSLPVGGRAIVVGHTYGDIAGAQGNGDAFVRKFDSGGDVLWTRQFGSGYFDVARAVATGPADEIVVVGMTSGVLTGAVEGGAFVRKYSASGTEVWTRQFGSGFEMYIPGDEARAVAVDEAGYVVVAGEAHGDLGASPVTFEADAFVLKWSP